jgi:hypothetical protein
MLDLLIDRLHDTKTLTAVLAAIAAIATVLTLTMPLLSTDMLGKRMNAVAIEREKMRQRERADRPSSTCSAWSSSSTWPSGWPRRRRAIS